VIILQALPRLTHPVYCKSMEKIVVSCTSISGQRRVSPYIQMMDEAPLIGQQCRH